MSGKLIFDFLIFLPLQSHDLQNGLEKESLIVRMANIMMLKSYNPLDELQAVE